MRNIPISDFTGPRVMRYATDGSRTMSPRPSVRARQMVERLEAIFASQEGDWHQGDWTAAFRDYLACEFDYGMVEAHMTIINPLLHHCKRLRAALEGRAVKLIGPFSPYWRCEICDAQAQSPLNFPHEPGCILSCEGLS